MTDTSWNERYKRATSQKQTRFLVRLCHNMTIAGRYAYPGVEELSDEERLQILQLVNEVQHKLSSHVLALLNENSERYPDDVICAILGDAGMEHPLLEKQMRWALDEAEQFCRLD